MFEQFFKNLGLSEEIRETPKGSKSVSRRQFLIETGEIGAQIALVLTGVNCGKKEITSVESSEETTETTEDNPALEGLKNAKEYLRNHAHSFFDNNPDYFKPFPNGQQFPENFMPINGEFPNNTRIERYSNKIKLLRDVGMSFYWVNKDEYPDFIIAKLSELEEFAYLKDQKSKLGGMNVRQRYLPKHIWFPIPIRREDRELEDEEFAAYCYKAIDEMKNHPEYGKTVEYILKLPNMNIDKLVTAMLATAKVESGGEPLGKHEFHRFEENRQAFSFSVFHIMIEDEKKGKNPRGKSWGRIAMEKLQMSVGQTYHPVNAAKLYLAFWIEKMRCVSKNGFDALFPLEGRHFEKYAHYFNGEDWQTNNYVLKLYLEYRDARENIIDYYFTPHAKKESPEKPKNIDWYFCGNENLKNAILSANTCFSRLANVESILFINQNVKNIKNQIEKYLLTTYKTTKIFQDDRIFVAKDNAKNPYVIFKEGKGKITKQGKKNRKPQKETKYYLK